MGLLTPLMPKQLRGAIDEQKAKEEIMLMAWAGAIEDEARERGIETENGPCKMDGWRFIEINGIFLNMKTDRKTAAEILKETLPVFDRFYEESVSKMDKALAYKLKKFVGEPMVKAMAGG
jgi:hypothetical protein